MKKILLYTLGLAGILCLDSCVDDFLTQKNTYQLDGSIESDEAASTTTTALYNTVWSGFNDKFYYGMGDGRANNITAQYSDYIYPYTNFTESSLSQGLSDAWSAFYAVVTQADNVINNLKTKCTSAVTDDAKNKAMAEARFMRGLAYWYIGSLWGCGIIYEDATTLVNNYVVPAQPRADVIEFALRDMEYAAKYLPTVASGVGRVNKYAAYGMLSRMYLSMAGITTEGQYDGNNVATDANRGTRNSYYLDLAKKAALKVIKESDAKLVDDYASLFHYKTINNNSESLFQLQFMPGDNMGGAANTMTRFLAWSTMVGDTNAWGGATYCSYDLWYEFSNYADATLGGDPIDDKIRRHNSVASYGEKYPELSADDTPYEYGVTESAGSQGANVKKYVIGVKKVNGISTVNNSGINTYMLRLAEVYLNYAEAVLGNDESTTDADALHYFNLIRKRAGVPKKSKLTYEDLRHEFRMEFAFEGLYWYQLVRRSYYKQQDIIAYVNNQYRNASYYEASTHEYKLSKDYTAPGPQVAVATARNLTLPVPDNDQTKNPNLKPDANGNITTVAFEFGEREIDEASLFE